ncbi:MAG TPA: hypothetical protein VFX43_21690 [Chitinophagaceae bacterium]|nr:hypothetical protein [Chitinophagaceae bacterium]
MEAFLFRVARNKALDFLRWTQKSKLQQMELWNRMQEMASESTDHQLLLADTESSIRQTVAGFHRNAKLFFSSAGNKALPMNK